MKYTVTDKPKVVPPVQYPYFAKGLSTGALVLVLSESDSIYLENTGATHVEVGKVVKYICSERLVGDITFTQE